MRKLAIITGLSLAAVATVGIAGLATAALVDTGSAVVVAVVVALGLLVIARIEWTHRRGQTVPAAAEGHRSDQDTRRALDELRAARAHEARPSHRTSRGHLTAGSPTAGTGHSAVSHALRSV